MGTLSAGEEGRPLSMSKGSSRRGLFFFSVSRSLISPEPWPWPSARVRTPDKKSAISSCRSVMKEEKKTSEVFLFSKKVLQRMRNTPEKTVNWIFPVISTNLNAAVHHGLRQSLWFHLCRIDSVEEDHLVSSLLLNDVKILILSYKKYGFRWFLAP